MGCTFFSFFIFVNNKSSKSKIEAFRFTDDIIVYIEVILSKDITEYLKMPYPAAAIIAATAGRIP